MSSDHQSTNSSTYEHPAYLDPSELGTKEYWDAYYDTDLKNTSLDLSSSPHHQESSATSTWFSDVDAPRKILDFLYSSDFPLSPNYTGDEWRGEDDDASLEEYPFVLDIGTGNGRMLFQLRNGQTGDTDSESGQESDGDQSPDKRDNTVDKASSTRVSGSAHGKGSGYQGPLYGIDYSAQSIKLARTINGKSSGHNNIHFHPMDVLADSPASVDWWPRSYDGSTLYLFDLILDKGTFDAVSLSAHPEPNSHYLHPSNTYPRHVARLLKLGGFLLVTSCNWTEDELIQWFAPQLRKGLEHSISEYRADSDMSSTPALDVYDTIKYPTFRFGGKDGAGVATVCFRRVK